MIKKNWKNRWKKTVAARHFPLSPPCQEWPMLLPQGISAFIFHLIPQLVSEGQITMLIMNTATSTLRSSGHLCMNPSGLSGLEFYFFPTLLPLSGHKPVLLDETIRSSDYKTTLAILFSGPLFRSGNFYWVYYLWWAGWYFLQKLDELILNFCMFLQRKTTIIYRQLCQNGYYGFKPAYLLACDPLHAGSLQMPFKDTWLSLTLWCLQGRLQLPHAAKGSTVRVLHGNQHRQGLLRPVCKLTSCNQEVPDARKDTPWRCSTQGYRPVWL